MSADLAPYTVDVSKVPGPDWTHSVAVETIERLRKSKASEKAIDVMRFMAIIGCEDGGVQMEWHAHGFDVEINVGADGVVECFWMNKRVESTS
jgi:hypothetical protein